MADPLQEAAKSINDWAASVQKEEALLASRITALLRGRGASLTQSLEKRAQKFADQEVQSFVQGK